MFFPWSKRLRMSNLRNGIRRLGDTILYKYKTLIRLSALAQLKEPKNPVGVVVTSQGPEVQRAPFIISKLLIFAVCIQ